MSLPASLLRRWPPGRLCAAAWVVAFTAVALVPLAWMLSSSVKGQGDVFVLPIQWIPVHPAWA